MRILSVLICGIMVSGCAMASQVMDAGNGEYLISAAASPIRGGAAGAQEVAYKDANAFCAGKGGHAIVITANDRDVYQSSFGGSVGPGGGSFGGGTNAAGNANMRFRCGQ